MAFGFPTAVLPEKPVITEDIATVVVVDGNGAVKRAAMSSIIDSATEATEGIEVSLGLDEAGDLAKSYNIWRGTATFNASDGTTQVRIEDVLDSVSNWVVQGGASGYGPAFAIEGDAADIDGFFAAKGNGTLWFGNGFSGVLGIQANSSGQFLLPFTSDGATLGSSSAQWSDLFLATGGVINFGGSNVTVTHSTNTLTISGTLRLSNFTMTAAAGNNRFFNIKTSDVFRWVVGGENTAESGSDVGTDFVVGRYNDAGTFQDFPLRTNRRYGYTTLKTLQLAETYTSAQIGDKTHSVNTAGKVAGKVIRNSTTHALMHCEGTADTSTWYAADGATSITPV